MNNFASKMMSRNFIFGTALVMIMALSANSYAAPNSKNAEKGKTENRSNYHHKGDMKKGDFKKGQGKSGSCHHDKKSCHKK